MRVAHVIILFLWLAFGVVWDLGLAGFVSIEQEEQLYLLCDFMAKVRTPPVA